MEQRPTPRVPAIFGSIPYLLTGAVICVGLSVFAGWFFNLEILKSAIPGLIAMNPTTALCFILLSSGILLLCSPDKKKKILGHFFAVAVVAIGVIRVMAYFTPYDFWIDGWLFREKLGTNRMAPNTALIFTMIGMNHLLSEARSRPAKNFSQTMLAMALFLATLAAVGYTFGARAFYNIPSFIPMALNTAVCFVFLGIASFWVTPDEGVVPVLTSPHAGGFMARRLLTAGVLVPYAIGYLQHFGKNHGWYGPEFGLAMMVSGSMAAFFTLIFFTARMVDRSDIKQQQFQEELQKLNDELEIRVDERTRDLRQAQQQLVQQERLRALGQMASGIAHDFNNALSPILGYSEMMLSDLKGSESVHAQYLKSILTAAKDAAEIVSRLRQFGRSREEDEPLAPLNINRLIEQTITLTQPKWKTQAMSKGIDVMIQKDLGEVPPVEGSEQQLREILTNLIFNAVDAFHQNGTIVFKTYGKDHYVFMEVRDNGKGMTEEVRKKCLEPFFTTKGEQGTGLGLAMVHGIVQRHGGTLNIESEPGKGTTFSIQLMASKSAGQKGMALDSGNLVRPLSILYAEDEPHVRQVIIAYLRRDGHKVEIAANGFEGLQKFSDRKNKFDLVITDRTMPKMRGEELAAAIRKLSPRQRIIILSGTSDMDHPEIENQNIDAMLTKPLTLEALRKTLRELFPEE